MRIITVILLLVYSSLSLAENDSDQYFCDINALKTIDYSADIAGYYQDDYDAMFPKWLAKAKSGDKKYQFYVAKAFQYGQGVAQNKKSALEWYTKSSDQGYAVAKNNLAFFYSDGEILDIDLDKHSSLLCDAASNGLSLATMNIAYYYSNIVDDNDKRVFDWMLKASLQGNVRAQSELGLLYFNGSGGALQSKSKALEWIQKSSNRGDAYAQNNFGWMYQNGEGVPKNNKKAFEWYEKSALQGHIDAQNNMGYMYASGTGTSKNFSKAFEWYKKSAEQGSQYAQNNLGWLYEVGRGVVKDLKKAFVWYEKSANQGYEIAQNNLDTMFTNGVGVSTDPEKAFEWYKKFALQGNAMAQNNLGFLYEKGEGVTQSYKKAFEWYTRAANNGNTLAQMSLGFFHEYGKGTGINYSKAFKWYQKAANNGDDIAQQSLGVLYESGKGVKQDLNKAFEWYVKAANQGNKLAKKNIDVLQYKFDRSKGLDEWFKWLEMFANYGIADAQNALGFLYSKGEGVVQNSSKAFEWYKKSAEQGNQDAQVNVASYYSNGVLVAKDYEKAFYWLEKAAKQGNAQAQLELAKHYALGRGVSKNAVKAFEWHLKAANQGLAIAQNNLGTAFMNGEGVDIDYIKSVEWYEKSAKQGLAIALGNLGISYQNGFGVLRDYKRAIELYKQAADKGYLPALMELSEMYGEGLGVEQDEYKAAQYYDKYAASIYLSVQKDLLLCYESSSCSDFNEREILAEDDNKKAYETVQEFELQLKLFTQPDKPVSIELLEGLAKKGDAAAQKKLGVIYWWSKKDTDKSLSLYWTKKAAQQGDSDAQNNYGTFFYNGDIINKDLVEAFQWYQKSANQGNTTAMRNLGSFYLLNNKDINNAIKYLKMAFNNGDFSSAWSLGYLYMSGLNGNKIDNYQAYEWMLKGAQANYKPAQYEVSKMLLEGKGVKLNNVTSFNWLLKAHRSREIQSDSWSALIRRDLAFRYFYGVGVESSIIQAQKVDPDYIMGLIGDGVISGEQLYQMAQGYEFDFKELKKALYWYEKAAEKGILFAQVRTGLLYSIYADSTGITPDYEKAESWFLKAINGGDLESMSHLAEMYYSETEATGVENVFFNPSKSFDLLIKAKESGATNYHMGLQYLYQFGIGVEKDLDKAISITEDKLKDINEWEKSYWFKNMWSMQIKRKNPDTKAISEAMTYFISKAKLGDENDINTLAGMYLNEDFNYYDEKEAIYWLSQIEDSSFRANLTLAIHADKYSNYGKYLIKAIELYESGKADDYISQKILLTTYSDLVGYFRDVEVPEKVESLMRKISQAVPSNEDNPWFEILNINLAGISEDSGASEAYLKDIVKPLHSVNSSIQIQIQWMALSNLQILYRSQREYEKSVKVAIKSLKLLDKFKINHDDISGRIGLLTYITRDYIQLKDFDSAGVYYSLLKDNMDIRKSDKYLEDYMRPNKIFENINIIWVDIIGAIIKINNGFLDEGFIELNSALDRVKKGDIPLQRQDLDFALMPLEYFTQNGDYGKASILMSKVIDLYQQGVERRIKYSSIILAEEKDRIRDAISEYIYVSKPVNNLEIDKGFEVMQLASGLTLSDTVIKSISNSKLSGSLLIKSKLLDELNNDRRALIDKKFKNLSSGSTKFRSLNININDLDQKINTLEIDLESSMKNSLDEFVVPISKVQDNLSEKDALITMLISTKRSYVWLVTKNEVFRHDSELSLSEVKKHSTKLLNALNPSNISNNPFPIESSATLYDLLIKPFEVELKGIDRLIFSPDPILSQIPFSILTKSGTEGFDVVANADDLRGVASVKIKLSDKSSNNNLENVEWLIKDFAIAIIPSVYSYVGLESSNEEEFEGLNSFLGIGNPALSGSEVVFKSDVNIAMNDQRGTISRTLGDLSALPETETELNTIANYFSSSEIITQGDATEAKIRDMDLSGINVIAFATHALVSNEIDDLFEPAIVLTPVDSNNPDNDGLLMASEVAKLNIDADIVLLSACNTASSFDESNSQGLSGLADSFFAAGAKSILVSYWSVISDSAVDITTKMFDKSNTGRSYSHKHRESVLKILEEPTSYKSNPVYWAPFMVVGIN